MNKSVYFILFACVFMLIIASAHYYLWARLVKNTNLAMPLAKLIKWSLIVFAVSLPIAALASRMMPYHVTKIVVFIPYVWMGVLMLFFFFFLSADIAKFLFAGVRKLVGAEDVLADPERRWVLARIVAGAAVLTVGGLTGVSLFQGARRAYIQKVLIKLKLFPSKLNGFKIVQLSDLHVGLTLGKDFIEEVVAQTNAQGPDLIAITGDLVDGLPDLLRSEIAPLKNLKAAHGVYFVTGNHEYYSGVDQWIPEFQKLGIKVLRNERKRIGEGDDVFYLAGVDDLKSQDMAPGHGPDMDKALSDKDPRFDVVLLAHQPNAATEATAYDVGLVLSGHTHGGQIWPFNYLVKLQQKYVKGLYTCGQRTQVYVNQGTGLWGPPMRLGTRGEITEIILERG